MTLSFPGGVHPEEMKLTAKNPIQKISAPAFVRLPLLQHIGSPAVPVVSANATMGMRDNSIAAIKTIHNVFFIFSHSF